MRAAVCPGGGDVRPCSVHLHVFETQAMAGIKHFQHDSACGRPRSDFFGIRETSDQNPAVLNLTQKAS